MDASVSLVDLPTRTVKGEVAVGSRPSGVGVDPVTGRVWVVSRSQAAASVIDPVAQVVIKALAVGLDPIDIAIDSTSGSGFIANAGDGSISVVDLAEIKVTSTVPLGDGPTSLVVDPGARSAYVLTGKRLSVFDTKSVALVHTISVAEGASGMALSRTRGSVFVIGSSASGEGWVSELTAG